MNSIFWIILYICCYIVFFKLLRRNNSYCILLSTIALSLSFTDLIIIILDPYLHSYTFYFTSIISLNLVSAWYGIKHLKLNNNTQNYFAILSVFLITTFFVVYFTPDLLDRICSENHKTWYYYIIVSPLLFFFICSKIKKSNSNISFVISSMILSLYIVCIGASIIDTIKKSNYGIYLGFVEPDQLNNPVPCFEFTALNLLNLILSWYIVKLLNIKYLVVKIILTVLLSVSIFACTILTLFFSHPSHCKPHCQDNIPYVEEYVEEECVETQNKTYKKE